METFLSSPKAISTLVWRSCKSISTHTRFKVPPMQPRAVPICKATHACNVTQEEKIKTARAHKKPVTKTSFSKICKITVLSMTSKGRMISISSS